MCHPTCAARLGCNAPLCIHACPRPHLDKTDLRSASGYTTNNLVYLIFIEAATSRGEICSLKWSAISELLVTFSLHTYKCIHAHLPVLRSHDGIPPCQVCTLVVRPPHCGGSTPLFTVQSSAHVTLCTTTPYVYQTFDTAAGFCTVGGERQPQRTALTAIPRVSSAHGCALHHATLPVYMLVMSARKAPSPAPD